MLAPVLLALALGQGCPEPLSPSDPPPCAAANVPGCLPGYRADRDARGRVVYVCDAAAPRRGPVARAPAPPYAAPEHEHYERYAPSAPPTPAPQAYPERSRPRGQLALVLMPGASTGPVHRTLDARDRDWEEELAAVALEIRGPHGGARARFALQLASFGRIAEVTFKYAFLEGLPLRPFLGLGLGAATLDLDPDRDWRASGSASAGIDLYLTENVFLTGEVQARRFASRRGDAAGLDLSDLRQRAALVGIGFYL